MTITPTPAEAFARMIQQQQAAISHENADLTGAALARHRLELLSAATAEGMKHAPAMPQPTDSDRAKVFDSLTPRTADAVAVSDDRWRQVERRVEAGQRLESIIASADVETLAAIAHHVPTMPDVLASGDAEGVVGDFRGLIFDRLVEAGHKEAGAISARETEQEGQAAWAQAFAEVGEHGQASLSTKGRIYSADREGYDAALQSDPQLGSAISNLHMAAERAIDAE